MRLSFSLKETIDELPRPHRDALIATGYGGLSQQQLECCHFALDGRGRIVDHH